MPRRKNLTPRVTVRTKRGKLYLRYRDPHTGLEELRAVKGKYQSQALREAGAWERELQDTDAKEKTKKAAELAKAAKLTWSDFKEKFQTEHLLSLSDNTYLRFQTVLNAVDKHLSPKLLSQIDAQALSMLQSAMRNAGNSESTIASNLGHLKVAMNWAHGLGLVSEVPKFPKIKRARKGQRVKPMKGRPPTEAEFNAMLDKVSEAVPDSQVANWQRFMRALWWGGLRLEEGLELHWDRLDKMRVDLDGGKRPRLMILPTTEKGGKARVYPIAPEFAALLRETPPTERTGLVFPLKSRKRGSGNKWQSAGQVGMGYASKIIIQIGALAGVVTHIDPASGQKHYAGAHDLRRAFGTRWARRVFPMVLQKMMRHESIETTQSYYVELDADEMADDIWSAWDKFALKPPRSRNGGPPRMYRLIWKYPHRMKKFKPNDSGDQTGD